MTEQELFRKLGGFNPIEDFGAPRENVALNPFTGKPIVSAAGQVATSMARGIPQLATGVLDLAGLPLTMSGVVDDKNVFGSTAYLESKGFLPPAQTGLINQGVEIGSSMFNPSSLAKGAIGLGAGILRNTNKDLSEFTSEAAELWRTKNWIPKDKQTQNLPQDPRVRQSFKNYLDGKISQTDYIKNMQNLYPANKITEIPDYPSGAEIVYALGKKAEGGKKVVNFGAKFDDGDLVTSRLDIPAYNGYNLWSASLKTPDGQTVYGQTVHLTNKTGKIKFNSNPNDAIRIAKGKELGGSDKFPFATIDGYWKNTSPDDVTKLAKKYLNDPEWSQVGMNPRRFGYFYDKADNMPVSEADEVIQIGALVLAKNVKKFKPSKSVTTTKTPSGLLLSY
jgi:hypothetical protein